jgi:predicted MPP superfamily phosphohydrolase
MSFLIGVVLLLAVSGHVAICIYANNRVHATGLPRRVVQAISLAFHALTVIGSLAIAWWCVELAQLLYHAGSANVWSLLVPGYLSLCGLVAVGPLPWSLWQRRHVRLPVELLSNHSTSLDLAREVTADLVGRSWRRLYVVLPRNESLRLEVNEKVLRVPRLDPALEGLSIAHLSDLHFTGAIARRWFEEVIERVNGLEADLVAVTGDLIDKSACIDWVPYTLGRLRARHGAFFVLGNHDLRVDWRRLRETLEDSGLVDLGGRWLPVEINGRPIVLAGNERPWVKQAADMSQCPAQVEGFRPLRILLSHSPDQIRWAQERDFDLLLAGHTHGGQIRLPLIGPVCSPSRYGVKYANGTFFEPPTLMHVSRGISGKTPLRYNCLPEATKLVLTPASPTPAS